MFFLKEVDLKKVQMTLHRRKQMMELIEGKRHELVDARRDMSHILMISALIETCVSVIMIQSTRRLT
jgi:hypothetical protein